MRYKKRRKIIVHGKIPEWSRFIVVFLVLVLSEVFLNSSTIVSSTTEFQSLLNNAFLIKTKPGDTMNKKIVLSIIKNSTETNLDPYLITCIIKIESSFRVNAVSKKGAVGLMQVKPSVAKSIAEEIMGDGNFDLHNPEDNITLGTHYLSKLIDYFGDLETALLAYNLGPTRVVESLKSNDELPKHYLKKIKNCYSKFIYTQ